MKIDPYKHKERYLSWREKTKDKIPDISKENSDIIKHFLNDMEHGINISISNVKGSRSYIRLNSLREKMIFFAKKFKELYNLNIITEILEEQICQFFSEIRNGTISRNDGKVYKSVADFTKIFKAFSSKQSVPIITLMSKDAIIPLLSNHFCIMLFQM